MAQTLTKVSVEACDDDHCDGGYSWNCYSAWKQRSIDGCDVKGLAEDHVRDMLKNRSLYLEVGHGTSEVTAKEPVWESQLRP